MYQIEQIKNKIICGDVFEEIKKIPNESIDLVIADPPYGVNYKGGDQNVDKANVIKGDVDAKHYGLLMEQFYRVLKTGGGGCYLFYANGKENDIFPVRYFTKHQILIWYKIGKAHGDFMARYMHIYEPILYLTKKSPTKWRGMNNQVDVLMDFRYEKLFHPTQKPLKIIKKLIENSSDKGDIVLDAFSGSGTTSVAAKKLGRNYIGIEIEEKFVKLANERIKLT